MENLNAEQINKVLGKGGRCVKLRDITVPEFDALLAKQISMKQCPSCGGYSGNIVIDLPEYGKSGVYVKCRICGFESRRKSPFIRMRDVTGRIATPVIDKSLIGAIRQAMIDYKKGVER